MTKEYIIAVLELAERELIRANQTTGYGAKDESFPRMITIIDELIEKLNEDENVQGIS